MAEAPGDPYDGVLLHYADPLSGGPTLPTMNCEVQMFRPGEKGRSHRHTHSSCTTLFAARARLGSAMRNSHWEQGDSFVVPLWSWHAHENNSGEPAILFSINDRPAFEALGFFREETRE
jgi:gentisate 1,2-dioxygenase